MSTHIITDSNFDEEIKNSHVPILVDFWAEWCGPCKQIGPALEELSDEYEGKVKIVKINVDENINSPVGIFILILKNRVRKIASTVITKY